MKWISLYFLQISDNVGVCCFIFLSENHTQEPFIWQTCTICGIMGGTLYFTSLVFLVSQVRVLGLIPLLQQFLSVKAMMWKGSFIQVTRTRNMKGTEHEICKDYWRCAQVQQRSWSLQEEKKEGFLVVSTESKALVVSKDWQDASQKSLGNAENRL